MKLIQTAHKGTGLAATKWYKMGDRLLFCGGPIIHGSDWPEDADPDYAIQVAPDTYLDPRQLDPIFLVNHSCHPNAGMVIKNGVAALDAIRHIKPDEEITWDYSTTMDDADWQMVCHCGQPDCRGVIRDFRTLPHDVKNKYKLLGVLPDFLLRKYP